MFWNEKSLAELSEDEWESLCDGCGRCCVWKFEDEDSAEVLYTDIHCTLFDETACRCRDYAHRTIAVPDCLHIRNMEPHQYGWLPSTCAYRLRYEGKPLFDWHPLISGDPETVHSAGISVRGRTVDGEGFSDADILSHIINPDDL